MKRVWQMPLLFWKNKNSVKRQLLLPSAPDAIMTTRLINGWNIAMSLFNLGLFTDIALFRTATLKAHNWLIGLSTSNINTSWRSWDAIQPCQMLVRKLWKPLVSFGNHIRLHGMSSLRHWSDIIHFMGIAASIQAMLKTLLLPPESSFKDAHANTSSQVNPQHWIKSKSNCSIISNLNGSYRTMIDWINASIAQKSKTEDIKCNQ